MFQNPNQPTKEFLDAQIKAMQALGLKIRPIDTTRSKVAS